MNKNDLNNISVKGPVATMNTIKADQRPLVPHFYGLSNSVGPARVTEDTGCLHCSVFIICPPSSLLYHFNFYRIIDFLSPAAPLCVLLLDKIFIRPKLTRQRYRHKKRRGKSMRLWKFPEKDWKCWGAVQHFASFWYPWPTWREFQGSWIKSKWGDNTYMYRMRAHLVIKYSHFLELCVEETTLLIILT